MCIVQFLRPERIDCKEYSVSFIDGEWEKNLCYLSKQFTFAKLVNGRLVRGVTLILWDNSLPDIEYPFPDVIVIRCDVNKTTIFDVAWLPDKLDVIMYYSPRDVEGMIGAKVWRYLLSGKDDDGLEVKSPISQMRNLCGEFELAGTKFVLKDWFGSFGTSLDKAFEMVGVTPIGKGKAEEYAKRNPGWSKADMGTWFREEPQEAAYYVLGDTYDLIEMVNKRIDQVNQIIAEALNEPGVEVKPFTYSKFPRTSGKLVAETFERWVIAKYPELYRATLLLTDTANDKQWKELEEILADRSKLSTAGNRIKRLESTVPGMAAGRIDSYILLSKRGSTGVYNSVVNGGRCVNEEPKENPYQQRLRNVINTDNASCYGTGLLSFDQPFGLPTIYERCKDDKEITLGGFLRKHKSELVPGLYQIIVTGKLEFEQDLVQSKYGLTTTKIERKIIFNFDDIDFSNPKDLSMELAHIDGDFRLTNRELECAIITSRDLEIIEKVSSNTELKGWMGLKVLTASYYPRSLEVSHSRFIEIIENPKTRGGKKASGDTRTRNWCRIPWREFVGKFIQIRKQYKTQSQAKGDVYDLLQTAVKLFVNTTYGDIAAPFFILGNTIVANNITAKARCGAWQMSKGLLGVQSITDGVLFSWERIARLKTELSSFRKPSFHTLANRERFMECRNVETTSLPGGDWYERLRETDKGVLAASQKELDKAILDHLETFWKVYDLDYQYGIESKYGETAREAVYFGTSDYLLFDCVYTDTKTADGVNYLMKVRGAKHDDHPKKLWMWHLLDPDKYPLPYPDYTETSLLKVGEFQQNPEKYPNTLPGYEVVREFVHCPHSPGNTFQTGKEMTNFEANKRKTIAKFKKERTPGTYYGLAAKIVAGKFKTL